MCAAPEDFRSPERLRVHYEIERRLADQLRYATREKRVDLYKSVYDELFRSVPDHPQLTRKADPQAQASSTASQLKMLERFLRPTATFLEIGPGDCDVSFTVSERVSHVYAVDVSEEITQHPARPGNVTLLLTDGREIPVPPASVDVAYSNQLMEHLHPDDAREQLENIFRGLAPGGTYVCATPNRLDGPHDISKCFDNVARGLHLKEYTTRELGVLLREVGFSRVQVLVNLKKIVLLLPSLPFTSLEYVLEHLPATALGVVRRTPLRKVLGDVVVATKAR